MGHELFAWVRGEGVYRDLAADCEAYLAGRLAERYEDRDGVVPTWAWTNLLAHGPRSDLADECARDTPTGLAVHRGWRRARAYLAAELLACADHGTPLRIVQARVLQPIEQELASVRNADLRQPNHWAAHVSAALTEHRGSRRTRVSGSGAPRKGEACHGTSTK